MINCLTLYSYFSEILLSNVFLISLLFQFNFISKKNTCFQFNKIKPSFFFYSFLLSLIFCLFSLNSEFYAVGEHGVFNNSTFLLKVLFLIFSFAILVFFESNYSFLQKIYYNYNFIILYFFVLLSSILLVSVNDFLSLFVVLEFQSLCLYTLACLNKNSATSTEAGLKYFVWGSIFTGIFLFAVSTIYGCTGTLNFGDLKLILFFNFEDDFLALNYLIFISAFCIFCVFLFKISSFPFHWWSPDVYEGAPLSSTFVFIFLPKIAFFTLLAKLVFLLSDHFEILNFFCLVLGCLTVFIGSFFTLKQNRLKRFLIFSSIAQIGFLLSVLSSNYFDSYSFLYFFLLVYLISSISIWGVYKIFSTSFLFIQRFENFSLLSLSLLTLKKILEQNFWLAGVLFIVFFSVAGIPPFAGFLAKLFIFFELLKNSYIFIVTLLALISAISVYYYIKIVKIAFFETTKNFNLIGGFLSNDFASGYDFALISISVFFILFAFWQSEFFLIFSKVLNYIMLG